MVRCTGASWRARRCSTVGSAWGCWRSRCWSGWRRRYCSGPACGWPAYRPPPGLALAAFVLAQTLGWISLVPGGLGVFEGAMLVLLGSAPGSPSALLAGLLLFRVVYYFVPFLLAARLLPGLKLLPEGGRAEALIRRFRAHPLLRFGRVPLHFLGRIGSRVLAYGTFAAGALLLLSAAFPAAAERLELLDRHLPWVLLEGFHFSSVLAGVLLLGLARGIAAGMRDAYRAAQIVLLAGALLALLKGVAGFMEPVDHHLVPLRM